MITGNLRESTINLSCICCNKGYYAYNSSSMVWDIENGSMHRLLFAGPVTRLATYSPHGCRAHALSGPAGAPAPNAGGPSGRLPRTQRACNPGRDGGWEAPPAIITFAVAVIGIATPTSSWQHIPHTNTRTTTTTRNNIDIHNMHNHEQVH